MPDFKRVLIGLVAAASIVTAPAMAQSPGDTRAPTVQMFDNFFLSLVAVRLCDNPEQRMMNMFTRNLLIVQEITVSYFQNELPDQSRAQIFDMINNRALALDQTIKSTIAENGCTDPEVINLVNMFDVHARMDLLNEEGGSQ